MKEIKFDPSGEPLKISFIFTGLIVASYTYTLREAESNKKIEPVYEGNNKNPEDDIYYLPLPVGANNGRIIEFSTSFKGLDPKNFEDYGIRAEIYQGEKLIGFDEDNGKVTGKAQDSLIFFKLIV
jgi:hypothetical protein